MRKLGYNIFKWKQFFFILYFWQLKHWSEHYLETNIIICSPQNLFKISFQEISSSPTVQKLRKKRTKSTKRFVWSFTPARFIPVISMLVRESAFENDMIYVKGSCHDVHEMAPSHEKGIFSTHTAIGECRKDRYHLSIPLKRPRDTALVRAGDRLYSLIPAETSGPSC